MKNIEIEKTLPPFELITYAEMLQRMPQLALLRKAEFDEQDDDEEYGTDDKAFYFDGDLSLNSQQKEFLERHPSDARFLAVNGNLELVEINRDNLFVTGNLYVDVYYPGYEKRIGGTIFARYYACFAGEDHEILNATYPCRIDTPYLFAWFFDVGNVLANHKTVVFIQCNHHDYQQMNIANPNFYWQEDVFVLRQELCYQVESRYFDSIYWNLNEIEKTLKQGKSIFIEGFDITCWPVYMQALIHSIAKRYREAFISYQEVLELSPNWYRAWNNIAQLCFTNGAFEQSLPFYEKAISLFPQKHKNLDNRSADFCALVLVRLRKLDKAVEMATYAIESSKENPYDEHLRYFPYRIRGEAYLLKSDWKNAQADLEMAISLERDNGSTNWLMGLVYHQLGDRKKAVHYHKLARQKEGKFVVDYDTHQNTDFFYKIPVTVDWTL